MWHGTLVNPSGVKVFWKDICFPNQEGGLGMMNFQSRNKTSALKLIWMFFFKHSSL